jgi:osmotically-inducible protein OsmY
MRFSWLHGSQSMFQPQAGASLAHSWIVAHDGRDISAGGTMADRWEDRNRGPVDRAGDEVRSWFGDDDAARRRQMDEMREDRRDWHAGGPGRPLERGWEHTREAARDLTDRDRDGRRGLSEWNDADRPSHRFSSRTAWGSPSTPFTPEPRPYLNPYDDTPLGYRSTYGSTGATGSTSYAGRGPRGYQRGDERIREDICDRLTDDHRVDASDIEIQVNKGEVTLSGSVRSREEKRCAEDVIERISGVRDVNNHLKIKAADEVLGTARSGASVLGLSDNPPPQGKVRST